MNGLIRYPGGKSKLSKAIIKIVANAFTRFGLKRAIEPFVGAGSISGSLLDSGIPIEHLTINDLDHAIFCMWKCVIRNPSPLVDMVMAYEPTPESFYAFKNDLLSGAHTHDFVLTALKKIVIHQISYSGLGTMAGSPIGGREQRGEYPVGCRWNADHIAAKIRKFHGLMSGKTSAMYGDFAEAIKLADEETFIYPDPPYWLRGEGLYEVGMGADGHQRLAEMLLRSRAKWLLSYDDHEEVRKLYAHDGIIITEISNTNTIVTKNKKGNTKNELLISNFEPSLV